MTDTKPKAAREFWIERGSFVWHAVEHKEMLHGWECGGIKPALYIEKTAFDALLEVVKIQREAFEEVMDADRSYNSKTWHIADNALTITSEMLKKVGVE